jgi:hypothetical protein
MRRPSPDTPTKLGEVARAVERGKRSDKKREATGSSGSAVLDMAMGNHGRTMNGEKLQIYFD